MGFDMKTKISKYSDFGISEIGIKKRNRDKKKEIGIKTFYVKPIMSFSWTFSISIRLNIK